MLCSDVGLYSTLLSPSTCARVGRPQVLKSAEACNGQARLVEARECALIRHKLCQMRFIRRLACTKSRVNLIPLHLHCSNVVLPSLDRRKKTLVELHAPLPTVYQKTLDALGLKVPDSISVLGANSDSIATKWKGKRAAAAEEKAKKKAEEK
jgi:hypothetical protein